MIADVFSEVVGFVEGKRKEGGGGKGVGEAVEGVEVNEEDFILHLWAISFCPGKTKSSWLSHVVHPFTAIGKIRHMTCSQPVSPNWASKKLRLWNSVAYHEHLVKAWIVGKFGDDRRITCNQSTMSSTRHRKQHENKIQLYLLNTVSVFSNRQLR